MKKRYVQAMMAGMTAMLSLAMPVTTVWAAVPETEKEQTVYVNADENGNAEKVIVSNWLKNAGKETDIADKSELSDIQNVKGEETFSKGSDGTLTWNAGGKDIYYQGESQKELPVSVKMTYFLDGKEIPASELAGKSGKVKIRIDYENKSGQKTDVNGKQENICTPFMMVTGMILPTEKFTNIEVENGKVISDGKNDIVVGMGFPGLADSLKLSDIEGMEEKKIPDYVEITADVEDFSLALTATVATTGTLKELGLDDIDSMDELEEKIDLLSDSSAALVEGSKALQDGVDQLNSSADTFAEGLNSADSGAGELKSGVYQLKDGISSYVKGADQLAAGAGQLAGGTEALEAGTKQLESGVKNYTANAAKISAGLGTLYEKLQGSVGVFATLPEKMGELKTNIEEMEKGAGQFKAGAEQVQQAAANLGGQMNNLKTGITAASGCIDKALGAIGSVNMPDVNAISQEATTQAQNAAKEKLNAANAQQTTNVQNALNAAGLSDEQKAAVMANLGSISTDVQSVQVNIASVTSDNSAAKAELEAAKQDLTAVAGKLGEVNIDTDSLTKLSEGAQTAADGAGKMQTELNAAAGKLGGMTNAQQMADELLKGVKDLKEGSEELCGYNGELNKGVKEAAAGAKMLNAGVKQLKAGSSELVANDKLLNNGVGQLADGVSELKNGTGQLAAGGTELKSGTTKLSDGSKELAEGMQKFDTEGIKKLTDLLSGETQNVLNRLKAVVDADEAYTAFDGADSNANGSVKFIIETAGIE